MKTPFEKADYSKDNKFKVLVDYDELRKGDIVTFHSKYDNISAYFVTQDDRKGRMYLIGLERFPTEVEVYEEPKKLTPLEDLEVCEESSLTFEEINSQLIKKDLFDLAVKHDVSLSQLEKTLKEIK